MPSTITAFGTGTGVEGGHATAVFHIDPPLAGSAQAVASVSGWGGASSDDWSGLAYSPDGSVWAPVPPSGLVPLLTGQSALHLRTQILTDAHAPETGEAVHFVVSQTPESGDVLVNSWWVTSTLPITDTTLPGGGGTVPVSIVAVADTFSADEGMPAAARFNLSGPLAADTVVNVSLNGWGAEAGADYTQFDFSTDGTTFAPVSGGSVTLPAHATAFWLRTNILTDNISPEAGESVQFAVSQTTASASTLKDSWWVTSTAHITDIPTGGGGGGAPTPPPLTISTTPTSTVMEGAEAIATYTLNGTLASEAHIKVLLAGWGAEAGTDFDGQLGFRTGNSGPWTPVGNGSTIAIAAGTHTFQLRTQVLADTTTPEVGESVVFVVSQESNNLTHSHWVQQVVAIQDTGGGGSGGGGTPPLQAQITAVHPSISVTEGSKATARFQLDTALPDAAEVEVALLGWTATIGTDTTGVLQYRIGNGSWADVVDHKVSVPAGKTVFELRTSTVNDLTTEIPETMVFTVRSLTPNLTDSWYVTTTATLSDADPVVRQGTPLAEVLSGSNTKQDIFDLSMGGSVGVVGGFDTIRNFGQGDVIKLPAAVNVWSLVTVAGDDWIPGDEAAREAGILQVWQNLKNGQWFDAGTGGVIKVTLGNNAYLMADSNGNGVFDSAPDSPHPDLFVKIVGLDSVALLTPEHLTT